jgi:AcrR family transcriptional regulator
MLQAGAGAGTREVIVRAALEIAAGGGWEDASLRAVRQRAGVSNGSLFHHFPTRRDLTAAVVAAGLDDHQRLLLAALGSNAERGVTDAVRRHLVWVEENPAVARLLLSAPPDLLRASVSEDVLDGSRRFFDAVADWLSAHGWRQRPQLRVVLALWIGPAQECSRNWLAAPDTWSLAEVADDVADGAWAALKPWLTKPKTRRGKATP